MKSTRILSLLCLLPLPALAHTPSTGFSFSDLSHHLGHSLSHGFMHPILGLDHLMVLIATAAWLSQTTGAQKIVKFIAVALACLAGGIALGKLASTLGLSISAQPAVVASLMVMGALAAVATSWSTKAKMGAVALVAVAHGVTHGVALSAPVLSGFVMGLLLSSALVLLAATALFYGVRHYAGASALKVIGFGAAMFGLGWVV